MPSYKGAFYLLSDITTTMTITGIRSQEKSEVDKLATVDVAFLSWTTVST